VAQTHGTVTASKRSNAATPASEKHTELPRDRFDDLPRSGRVGVHRIVGAPRRFWIYLVSALLGIVLLTGIGMAVVHFGGASIGNSSAAEKTPDEAPVEQNVKAELNPDAAVVVLNGTPMVGFGAVVDGLITSNGWGTILFSGDAASDAVEISAVFYSAEEDEAAALALANELGGVSIYQSSDYDEYGAQLVVLIGSDYAGPGSDQLVIDGSADGESAE
jgi:hypothetical protein